jgi:hypothetical protein
MNIATPDSFDPVARAMSALQAGYYWVRLAGDAVAWEIAHLQDGVFWACGADTPMRPGNIVEIGEQVRPYNPNPNPPESRGDYWVRLTREGAWRLAYWAGGPEWGRWFLSGPKGEGESYRPEDIAVVGPRVLRPGETWVER